MIDNVNLNSMPYAHSVRYVPKSQKTPMFETLRCPYCSNMLTGSYCSHCDKVITDKDISKKK